jgi:hypothetical protein
LARFPNVPVLVHVPVHGFPFSNLGSPLDHPREHRYDSHEKLLALAHGFAVEFLVIQLHRFLVNGNVNRLAVNVNVSRPTPNTRTPTHAADRQGTGLPSTAPESCAYPEP